MATIKAFLDKRRTKKDGTHPLRIRITHQRKSLEIPLNTTLKAEYWNMSKSEVIDKYPNAKLLNLKIKKRLHEIQEKVLQLEIQQTDFEIADIKSLFIVKQEEEEKSLTINEYAQKVIEQQRKSGRIGNANSYKTGVAQFIAYTGNAAIKFEDMTYQLLVNWEVALRQKGVKINSIGAYMRAIRAIFNQAIKSGVTERKYYPFSQYKIKSERTIQRTLSRENMKAIECLILDENAGISKARDLFILSFNLIGMNFRDMALLTNDNIHGNRIIYKRQKTHKIYSIKVTAKARELFAKYKGQNDPFLLPIINCKYFGDKEKQVRIAKETLKNYNNRHLYTKLIGFGKYLIAPK